MKVETLAELAMSTEVDHKYMWDDFNLDREQAYYSMAEYILSHGDNINVLRSLSVHLLAEHFLLNLQIEADKKNK